MAEENNMNNKNAAKNAAKAAADLKRQKKKKWFPILAPETFQNKYIGEVLLEDPASLMRRTVTVNMLQLMGDMKKQNVNVMFRVIDVKEGKGLTQAEKFEVSAFSLKRLAKREKDKLSDSFVVKTADGKLVRIKPVMITNNMTNGAVLASLIKTCRAVCKDIINKTPFDQLIIDLVTYDFQKDVRDSLHKVYPLRNFDIKMLQLETKKKNETVEEEMLMKLRKEQEQKDKDKAEEIHDDSGRSQDEESEGSQADESEPVDSTEEPQETKDETDDEDSEKEEE
jgi:ribosomal protein S3AE